MTRFCCSDMKWAVEHKLIYKDSHGVYSIDNKDDGIDMRYCAWCKHELPDTFIPKH